MTELPDLSQLTHEEKDALIRALWAQVQALTAQVQTLAVRVAELEARLGAPPKTPDNSSLPPSKGRKPNRPEKAKRHGPSTGPPLHEGRAAILFKTPVPALGEEWPEPEKGGRRMGGYVHGYDGRETARLEDQARTLEELLHVDTGFPDGSTVLEAGCGTGAQTVAVAQRSTGARITAVDVSAASLAEARARVSAAGFGNVEFRQADLLALPFAPASFDHIFLCFVLEHLPDPAATLAGLRPLLRPGGTITVIEGDHGSTCFHPDSEAAHAAISCQVKLQRRASGDAMIGRRLYPLLAGAGFEAVRVSPRMVYVDASKPALVDGFIRRTFTAMIEGVRESALAAGLTTPDGFDAGTRALHRTAEPDGVFCYTFFKAVGRPV